MGIFSLDGSFVKVMSLVADIIILSVLFFITSIPVVTIGPSSTALYYVMTRRIYDKEAYIFRDYFKSFKLNFIQSFLTWLAISILGFILVFNVYSIFVGFTFSLGTIIGKIFLVIYLALILEVCIVSFYIYAVIARFELKFVDAFKKSLLLGHMHLPTTFTLACLSFLVVYITYANPFLFIVSMGIYSSMASYFLMKVFRKHNPTIDLADHEISYEAINERKKKNEEKEKKKKLNK